MKGHIEDILVGGRPMTKNEIKIKELQDRIDKAIEYLEDEDLTDSANYHQYDIKEELKEDLLGILKGE